MPEVPNLYEQLLAQGFTKKELHGTIYKLILTEIKNRKKQITTPAENQPGPVVRFIKKVNIRKLIHGKALSLLKTQFAKKPKNPV